MPEKNAVPGINNKNMGKWLSTRASFTEILDIYPRRLDQTKTVEFDTFRHMGLQLLPDAGDENFDGTHLPLHEIDIQIEVPVVKLIDDMPVHDRPQLFHIEYETGFGIGYTLDRDIQLEIMPVPMLIGASPEHLFVLLPAPAGIIELVCGIEVFDSCEIDHRVDNTFVMCKVTSGWINISKMMIP